MLLCHAPARSYKIHTEQKVHGEGVLFNVLGLHFQCLKLLSSKVKSFFWTMEVFPGPMYWLQSKRSMEMCQ